MSIGVENQPFHGYRDVIGNRMCVSFMNGTLIWIQKFTILEKCEKGLQSLNHVMPIYGCITAM